MSLVSFPRRIGALTPEELDERARMFIQAIGDKPITDEQVSAIMGFARSAVEVLTTFLYYRRLYEAEGSTSSDLAFKRISEITLREIMLRGSH